MTEIEIKKIETVTEVKPETVPVVPADPTTVEFIQDKEAEELPF